MKKTALVKKTALASALLLAMGTATVAEANTAGLTGVWTGLYSFDMTDPGDGVVPDTPALQAWTWDFDAGTVSITNTETFFFSVWTAHDVTFNDTGTSYGDTAVNMLFDWSVNLNIPVISDWDVTATGNVVGDTAVVGVNNATITAGSPSFPGFHPAFTGSLTKVPVPAAAWLFGSGLLGLVGVARRRRNS